MPANLPPQYFEAEKRYREGKTPEEKIDALEEMLMIMPKHKGTDKLRADLRRRISKIKSQALQKKGASKQESAYAIAREGAAQVVVIGPPNVGKSSLLTALTNASPEVAAFPHTTWKPTPGMVTYENIQFQLVDTPPLSKEYVDPLMTDLLRRADILLVLLDLHADPLQQLEDTMSMLRNWRIFPIGYPVPDDLKKPPFLKKMIILMNKMDTDEEEEDLEVFIELSETTLPCLGISTQTGRNLSIFVQKIFDISGLIRVYTKAPGKPPDKKVPFIMTMESTLEDLAEKIHKDFAKKLKFAKIWGEAVYDGQMVQRDYVLREGDVVEIHI